MQFHQWEILLALVFGGLALTGLIIPEVGYVFLGLAVLLAAHWSWPNVNRLLRLQTHVKIERPIANLAVTVKRSYFGKHAVPLGTAAATSLDAEILFRPANPPIQLASVSLLFEGAEHQALATSTQLIERDHSETFRFDVGGEYGSRLIMMGLNQGEGIGPGAKPITTEEWPKARLHIVAGPLDFETEPFLAPTPTKPLAPDTEDSQNQGAE